VFIDVEISITYISSRSCYHFFDSMCVHSIDSKKEINKIMRLNNFVIVALNKKQSERDDKSYRSRSSIECMQTCLRIVLFARFEPVLQYDAIFGTDPRIPVPPTTVLAGGDSG